MIFIQLNDQKCVFSFQVDFPHLQKYRNEIKNCLAIVVEMPYQYGMVADVTHWGNLCIQDFENEYTSGNNLYGNE